MNQENHNGEDAEGQALEGQAVPAQGRWEEGELLMPAPETKPITPASDPKLEARLEAKANIRKMVDSMPADTPDEFIVYGYGSHRLTLGDLKRVVAG